MKLLIVCAGELPVPLETWLPGADALYAADGGANACLEMGLIPNLVVGDLDSFDPLLYPGVPVEHDPDQETNDLEKTLIRAERDGFGDIIVLGATGKRLDHTLKNLSVLKQYRYRFDSIIFRMKDGWLYLSEGDIALSVRPGQIVSMFPLSGIVEGIITDGLKYPLYRESLENGRRDGSSNEATQYNARIQHTSGDLIVMVYDLA
jgi:thiamine pyrophosphokinase